MNLDGKHILVTGGAGFIGSHLVDRLLSNPSVATVRVLDNLVNGKRENLTALAGEPRLSLQEGDILDPLVVARAIDGVNIVFHLACLGVRHSLRSPVENHQVNAEGTLQVLEASRRAGVERFVFQSSSEVYGSAQTVPMDENHPTWPETIYGASKLAGEAYARAYHRTWDVPAVIVRGFNEYGPRSHYEGDSGELIPRTIVRILCGSRPVVFGDGEQTRDYLHVTDLASALYRLAECDRAVGRTVNVGSGTEFSINRVCETIAHALGRPDLTPLRQAPRPGDVRRLLVDNRQARELIGFAPTVSLERGIHDLVGWFRNLPMKPWEMAARMPERNWEPSSLRAAETARPS